MISSIYIYVQMVVAIETVGGVKRGKENLFLPLKTQKD